MGTIVFEFSLTQEQEAKGGKESLILRNEISSSQIDNFFYFTLKGADNFYTYLFRLWRMVTYDLMKKNGGTFLLPTQGQGLIETVSQEPYLALLITLVMAGFSLLAAVYYCLKEKEKEEEQKKIAHKDYKNSNAQIDHWMKYKTTSGDSLRPVVKLPEDATLDRKTEEKNLNICLKKILTQPQYQGYANATIEIIENKFSLSLNKKTKLSLANMADASWKAGMQAGFIYWIGWIAAGCITGMLTFAIFGIPLWLAFGVPLFAGALPRLVQTWHWIKRHLEIDPQSSSDTASYLDRFKHFLGIKSQPTPEDVAMANQLMVSCIRERELDSQCEQLGVNRGKVPVYPPPGISNDVSNEARDYLIDYAATKTLAIGFLSAVSMYGMAHYILWIASDIFPSILLSATLVDFLSIAAFAVAGMYGIAGIRKKLNEIEQDKSTYQFDNAKLLQEYRRIQHEIGEQTNDPIYQMPLTPFDYNPRNEPICEPTLPAAKKEALTWQDELIGIIIYLANCVGKLLEHPITKFFDRAMMGGFVTRVFLLLCTSPFLPSAFHMATAVAVVSSPATLLIITTSFLVWGTFRYYLDKVSEKEKQIRKEMAEEVTKKETILHAIQLANIKLAAFKKKPSLELDPIKEEKIPQQNGHPLLRSPNLQPPSGWGQWIISFISSIRSSDKPIFHSSETPSHQLSSSSLLRS